MNPRKNDFERAVSLLHRDGYTCVLCDRDRVLTSREHGLAPLIRLLDTNESLQDMAAADRPDRPCRRAAAACRGREGRVRRGHE